ncbi:hypothetical protein ACN42_g11388 [Penicillium freii]|uniref:Uncharacterized protein n=1 Tax=Penicillium freii TaxID=48697 RepID=A0A101M890_PENFR|nr:hypothetical protein ACN42_g11388 [Penicillium freii]
MLLKYRSENIPIDCNTGRQDSNQGFARAGSPKWTLKTRPIPMQKKIRRSKKRNLRFGFRNSRTRGSNPQP